MKLSKSHPRYESLRIRELIELGVKNGITSSAGLIAHGRGEAFDYLLGEKTHGFAKEAVVAAAKLLLIAKHPVISVNGNAAALVAKELIALAAMLHCPLEVNIFHESKEREKKIKNWLIKNGANQVVSPEKKFTIKHIASNRKYVNGDGIYKADVVFVPLEDGDRAEALVKNGKKVITIDLNPLSRTAKIATITIVDNITRGLPLLLSHLKSHKLRKQLKGHKNYDNHVILQKAELALRHVPSRI